jgi:hypothetical protein
MCVASTFDLSVLGVVCLLCFSLTGVMADRLESKLRSFACLTKNDVIGIEYNGQIYELKVLDTKPAEAVSIIECDMKV